MQKFMRKSIPSKHARCQADIAQPSPRRRSSTELPCSWVHRSKILSRRDCTGGLLCRARSRRGTSRCRLLLTLCRWNRRLCLFVCGYGQFGPTAERTKSMPLLPCLLTNSFFASFLLQFLKSNVSG